MSNEGVDTSRRRFLTRATAAVGGAGVVAALYPFLASMAPSERAQAAGAPVEVDVSQLQPGERLTTEWRGRPVWVVRRSDDMLARLRTQEIRLRDPDSERDQQPEYARNEYRSIREEYLVLVGICTHLGCSPLFRPDAPAPEIHEQWSGGFFCPCHGSYFDLAGRVYAGVPAQLNMAVPPHRYASDTVLVIGEDGGEA